MYPFFSGVSSSHSQNQWSPVLAGRRQRGQLFTSLGSHLVQNVGVDKNTDHGTANLGKGFFSL